MPGQPYYILVDCCNADNNILINIPASTGIVPDGIYTFTTDIPNVGGTFDIVEGDCYILRYQSSPSNGFTNIPFSVFTLQQAGEFYECTAAAGCPDCAELGSRYIKADPCCDGDPIFLRGEPYIGGSQGSSSPSFNIGHYDGVYMITVTQDPEQSKDLVRGQCYNFSTGTVGDGAPGAPANMDEYELLEYPPLETQMNYVDSDCIKAQDARLCPPCDPTCYLLTACDGQQIQSQVEDLAAVVGNYIEIQGSSQNPWFVQINEGVCTDPVLSLVITDSDADPCPCNCYEVISAPGVVNYIDCEGRPQTALAPDKFCAQADPIGKSVVGQPPAVIINQGLCEDGECVERCFQLINCDPEKYPDQNAIITSTLQSLYQYINPSSVVELAGYEGCWTVIEATCLCLSVNINGRPFEANYTGSTYNNAKVFAFDVEGTTYHIWGGTTPGTWFITEIVGDLSIAPLAEIKVGILDCPIADETVWMLSGSWESPVGKVTSLSTTECPGQDACDCPVDVTVTQDYRTCEECIGPVAYKLTNCDGGEVTYTTEDLFEHIGKIIKDDCHCWLVEQIDYQPPSVVTLGTFEVFLDCISCLSTFYNLVPCERGIPSIVTNTNLSGLVGQVVQIDGCEGCYTVSTYDSPGQPVSYQGVEVTVSFPGCDECLTLTPRCSTVFNTTTEDQVYQYVDVNGNQQFTDTVCSGHTSLRYCVQKWDERIPGIFNYYGDCTVFEPDRTVTPRFVGAETGERPIKEEAGLEGHFNPLPVARCKCFIIEMRTMTPVGAVTNSYTAIDSGQTFQNSPVWDFEINNTPYYVFRYGIRWIIDTQVGDPNDQSIAKAPYEGNTTCPALTEANPLEWDFLNSPDCGGSKYDTGCVGIFLKSWVTDGCREVNQTPNLKLAHCPQYFPNNRKVKPGYNTPICSSEKYDKITCNFAEIAYKEALALRYGISNCCPELDEKWLISKELIELQALQDPQFNCPPITDCCGKTRSNCSCNS